MCHQCQCGRCGHTLGDRIDPSPFRFTDIPVRQWVIGTFMTLAVALAILARMT